ncbi:hypothetical protein [Paenibacillus pasadenensis]|nr:hypothetical protein [Paenibacillus pasadenensis]
MAYETLLRYLIYFLTVGCAWLAVSPLVVPSFFRRRQRNRFRGADEEKWRPKGRFYTKMELFLSSTIGAGSPFVVYSYVVFSVALAAMTLLFLSGSSTGLINALVISLLVGGMPTLILLVWRQRIRIGSSYEGDAVISELIAQYKLNHLNMLEAIDKTIPRVRTSKYSRRALSRLSMGVKENGSSLEIERLTKTFSYTFGTNWAELLANNIYLAIVYRDNVKEALDDILDELTNAKAVNEKGNQENSESFMIIKFVAPVSYIASVFAIVHYFDFSWSKFISYQFGSKYGIQSFLLVLLFMFINLLIFVFLRRPKNDI